MAASHPSHVRSISLPSRDHPSILKTEQELRKLKSFIAQSSLTSHMILDGLKELGSLYECINELLHLPSSNQHCSDNQQKKWIEVELEGSIRLLDLLATLRDSMQQINEHIRGHEMALRRRGEAVTKIEIHTNILPDKKLRKNIQSCFRELNRMDNKDALGYIGDEEFGSSKMFKILKEARELTISLLQSVFNFLSMPRPKTKASRWSLISNGLRKRKVACKDEQEDVEAHDGGALKIQFQLQVFQNSVEHIEEGLDFLYRRIIRNRVAALNFFSL